MNSSGINFILMRKLIKQIKETIPEFILTQRQLTRLSYCLITQNIKFKNYDELNQSLIPPFLLKEIEVIFKTLEPIKNTIKSTYLKQHIEATSNEIICKATEEASTTYREKGLDAAWSKLVNNELLTFDDILDIDENINNKALKEFKSSVDINKICLDIPKQCIQYLSLTGNNKIIITEMLFMQKLLYGVSMLNYLKLPSLALLINKFINKNFKDYQQKLLPKIYIITSSNLQKAIKFASESLEQDIIFVYKDASNHSSVLYYTKIGAKTIFYHIDSLGIGNFTFTQNFNVEMLLSVTNILKKENLEILNTTVSRQHDLNTCDIFAYKDIKEILKHFNHFRSFVSKKLTQTDIISNDEFPSYLHKLTQNTSFYDRKLTEEINDQPFTIRQYIENKKVKAIAIGIELKSDSKGNLQNFISKYSQEKYIAELPKYVMQNFTLESFIELLDSFELPDSLEQNITLVGSSSEAPIEIL